MKKSRSNLVSYTPEEDNLSSGYVTIDDDGEFKLPQKKKSQ
jgi:hypothetical protein